MGKIVLLDDLTINQIAAGEVIERPASAVKEMVENSIDAGAKNITVEIKNGGISLIRITDDGAGLAVDDMEMAFERHATSKIRKAEDLQIVDTMGFRGEALASIASIANVEMISKRAEDDLGHKIVLEGGEVKQRDEVAAQTGTRITVQKLFYNTPVRYKFLKKDYTEAGYIETVVTRIALANKDVAIQLISNDKVLLKTNGDGDFKNLLYSIYGKDVAEGIVDVDYTTYEDIKVSGVIGKTSIARSNRANQMFFVNNRYIKDGKLSSAAEQAYKDLLPAGKYAFLILNIEVDPKKVDVNVHPAKLEVRFQEDAEVFRAVYNAIKSGIAKFPIEPKSPFIEKQEEIKPPEVKPLIKEDLIAKIEPDPIIEEAPVTTSNDDISGKEVKLGDTKISSNTRAIDFNIAEALKDATQVIDTTKKIQIQETQVIPITKPQAVAEETQTIDISKELKSEPAIAKPIVEKEEEDVKQEVAEEVSEVSQEEVTEETKPEIPQIKEPEKVETTVPSIEAVENMTSRILEMKMNNLDNTQMIDTSRVREAMNELKDVTPEFANMYKKTFGVDANIIRKERKLEQQEREKINVSKEFVSAENTTLFDNEEAIPQRIDYKLIGTAFNTNIIIELNNEMYIIDQNVALQRLTYETVKAIYYNQEYKDSQALLLPDIVTVSYREMSLARENIELFHNAGFDFEEFGENTIKLTAVPSFCEELNTKQLFINVLNEIDRVALNEREEKEEKFITAIAKNATGTIRRELDEKEIDEILQKLLSLDNPFEIIDGVSTAIKMSRADIEKKFSRRK